MSVPAVPAYLNSILESSQFREASPGLRFNLFFPIWQPLSRWQKSSKKLSEQRWNDITQLSRNDQAVSQALRSRQKALICTDNSVLSINGAAMAPFTTGLGNEHPLENGFAFLNPYGLPYLPASGVKGVLRQAARELASDNWPSQYDWTSVVVSETAFRGAKNQKLTAADVFFGYQDNVASGNKDSGLHVQGVLEFWDVIPELAGDRLAVDIMTPHQAHYYQQSGSGSFDEGIIAPHDSGSPIPIQFLTIPAGSLFTFHLRCDRRRLGLLAPSLLADDAWKAWLQELFDHAFEWLGFGAKTAVGYGAFQTEDQKNHRREAAERHRQMQEEKAQKEEEARLERDAEKWERARIQFSNRNKSLSVEKDGRSAIAVRDKGEQLLATLPKPLQNQIRNNFQNKRIYVTAYVSGNDLIRVEPFKTSE